MDRNANTAHHPLMVLYRVKDSSNKAHSKKPESYPNAFL